MLMKEEKQAIIDAYKTHEGDTGSPEVQIAILTTRTSSPSISRPTQRITTAAAAC